MRIRPEPLADVAAAALVLVPGAWAVARYGGGDRALAVLVLAIAVAAAAIARRRPAWALAAIWVAGSVQLAGGPSAGRAEFALLVGVLVVAYRTARHGARGTVWASGLSIPVGVAVALGIGLSHPESFPDVQLARTLLQLSGYGLIGAVALGMATLAMPWTCGLLVRATDRYRIAEAARAVEEAHASALQSVADVRAQHARLARDVHDVVGHSLAVIIAQADAARLAAGGDEQVRDALARISAVGRSSLAEVRSVLAETQDDSAPLRSSSDDLDELIASVRAAGHPVRSDVVGEPVELGEPSATAAYRVLQELLTNALKHGTPGGTIEVDRQWSSAGLTLRVANPAGADNASSGDGTGLAGMHSRLAAVGGTFRTSTITGDGRPRVFAATAFVPAPAGVA